MDLFGEEVKEEEPAVFIDTDEEAFVEEGGLNPPRRNGECFGHGGIERFLLEMYTAGRMPHALVFAGPKGIGKATTAYRLARFLLKQGVWDPNQDSLFGGGESEPPETMDVPSDNPVFSRVASGGHPDLLSVEPEEEKGLKVEQLRKVTPFLRMKASEGGWRVVIVDDADTMNRNAQNALLKILEEPPSDTVLILVTHRPGALIPTIRSRCRMVHFQPLAREIVQELVSKAGLELSLDGRALVAMAADGSVGRALRYAENGAYELPERIAGLLDVDAQMPEIHKFADQLSAMGQDALYTDFQEILLWMLSRAAVYKARNVEDELTQCFQERYCLEDLAQICETLQAHFGQANGANLDKRQTVLGAFMILRKSNG